MGRIHREAPYYDDYDPNKGYVVVLTKPGYGAQARENTQQQTMMYDYMSRLGDYLLKPGTIVDGCTPLVKDNTFSITSGRIYIDGLIRLTEAVDLPIQGSGTEIIGCKLISDIVTSVQDASLVDPAPGFDNSGQSGADRVREYVVFTVDDSSATVLWTLQDGEIVNLTETVDDKSPFVDLLAKRTYDESGSYKVEGFQLFPKNETSNNNVVVGITSGTAYIRGYEVFGRYASNIVLDRALDFYTVYNEPKLFSSGIYDYLLSNQPYKEIKEVSADIQYSEQITRGQIINGQDMLSKTPVVRIVSVTAGSTTYTQGTDYSLVNNTVDWALSASSGNTPSVGSTYTVVYQYVKTLEEDVDYTVVKKDNLYYLRLLTSGDLPVPNSRVEITYDYYLARKDLICLDAYGNFVIYKGNSDVVSRCETPLNRDKNLLEIGSVLLKANSNEIVINNYKNYRLTMSEIYNLSKRLDDVEYNIAVTDLDAEAEGSELPTTLKGIYTDKFISLDKSDVTHREWYASLDIDNGRLTIPFSEVSNTLSLKADTSKFALTGNIYTSPYTTVSAFSQDLASTTMLVNPYAVYRSMSLVSLNPNMDNWIDSSSYVVNTTASATYSLRQWWYYRGSSWAESERQKWLQLTGGKSDGSGVGRGSYSGTITTSSKEIVLDEAIFYMRQITLTATGSNFEPNSDNIYCYFDGKQVPLTPLGGTQAGTNVGTVRAKADGTFKCSFVIPKNVACGTVKVSFESPWNQGETSFTASGRKVVTKETILTTKVVVRSYDPDPLAQLFAFANDTVLTKVGLFFATKDPNKSVVIQIRDVVNGYPGPTCYSEVVVPASAIKVSNNSATETVVQLPNLVHCEKDVSYCLTILSDSNLYSVYVAELGGTDIITGTNIASNPSTNGVLFSSSNAQTWTAHQTMDMKFRLYRANFETSGSLIYNSVSTTDVTRFLLAGDAYNPFNNNINYYYRYGDNLSWTLFEPYIDLTTSELVDKFDFKVEFDASANFSPMFSPGGQTFIGFSDKKQAIYISKNITLEEAYTKIRVIFNAYLPSGTSAAVYYATDISGTRWTQLTSPVVTPVSTSVNSYEYTKDLSGDLTVHKSFRVKIVLNTNSSLVLPWVSKLMNILKV